MCPDRRSDREPATLLMLPRGTWVAFVVLNTCLLMLVVYLVGVRQIGMPAASGGFWRFTVGELAGDLRIGQTLCVGAAGFNQVVFRAQPRSQDPAGDAILDLYELAPEGPHLLYRRVLPAAALVARGALSFEFPPIKNSSGRCYRVDVRQPHADQGHGIVLWAASGDRYGGGALFIDDREQPADLVFTTTATRATAWARLAARFQPTGPNRPWGRIVVALLFGILTAAVVLIQWWILTSSDPRPRGPHPRRTPA